MLTGDHLVIALIDRRALGPTDTCLSEPAADPPPAAAVDSGYAGRFQSSATSAVCLACVCCLMRPSCDEKPRHFQ